MERHWKKDEFKVHDLLDLKVSGKSYVHVVTTAFTPRCSHYMTAVSSM